MAFMHSERCRPGLRFFSMETMETADQYRSFAEECDRLAKQAIDERHRKVLKEMAVEWRRLAQAMQK